MENNEVVTPRDYVLKSIDNISDDIKFYKGDLIIRNIISYFCITSSYLLDSRSFEFVKSDFIKALPSITLGLVGVNFILNIFKHGIIANMEEQVDTLQEKLDLSDISSTANNKVHEARRYLVTKIEDVNSKRSKKYNTAKVLAIASGIAFIMAMFSHNGYILESNGFLIVLESILAYVCADRSVEMFADASKDDRISERINTTLDLDEVKRTRKMPKNM